MINTSSDSSQMQLLSSFLKQGRCRRSECTYAEAQLRHGSFHGLLQVLAAPLCYWSLQLHSLQVGIVGAIATVDMRN